MGVKITLDRTNELLAAVSNESIVDTLADMTAELARRRAPVDTGQLRDSIKSENGMVVAEAPYAQYVEYGTIYTPAQPFLTPAFNDVADIVLEIVQRGLRWN